MKVVVLAGSFFVDVHFKRGIILDPLRTDPPLFRLPTFKYALLELLVIQARICMHITGYLPLRAQVEQLVMLCVVLHDATNYT